MKQTHTHVCVHVRANAQRCEKVLIKNLKLEHSHQSSQTSHKLKIQLKVLKNLCICLLRVIENFRNEQFQRGLFIVKLKKILFFNVVDPLSLYLSHPFTLPFSSLLSHPFSVSSLCPYHQLLMSSSSNCCSWRHWWVVEVAEVGLWLGC